MSRRLAVQKTPSMNVPWLEYWLFNTPSLSALAACEVMGIQRSGHVLVNYIRHETNPSWIVYLNVNVACISSSMQQRHVSLCILILVLAGQKTTPTYECPCAWLAG